MEQAALFEHHQGTRPLLISVPHAGIYVPSEIAARMTEAGRALPDTDWFVHHLYGFARDLGASVLVANWSRYVVDLNRPPDGAALYPGRRESALCPLETFGGDPIYKPGHVPSQDEMEARKERYWRPYHRVLQAELERMRSVHGRVLLWDAHSIRGNLPLLFEGRLPDLNFGTNDGRSCRAELIERVLARAARAATFTHVLNGRFKGGYITRHYGRPEGGIDAIQLELAERSYMDEDAAPRWEQDRARPLQDFLRTLLDDLTR